MEERAREEAIMHYKIDHQHHALVVIVIIHLDLVTQTFDHWMTEREIGHEMTVHHVQVQIVGTILQQPRGVLVQLRQIRVQDGRANFRFHLWL